jgi:FMN-dependent NADH-azoreductase
MTTLLKINSSIHSDNGQSSQLADQFVTAWRDTHPNSTVIVRDLARIPVPHLDAERFGALIAKPELRSVKQREVVTYSDNLIDEVRKADTIVLGLPMYNFGIPSTLKAYFDHIARAGVTFRYTEKGPIGLLTNKKVVVFATRGGYYAGTALDTQTSYLQDFLRFLGITDVEFIYAEGLAISGVQKQESLAKAKRAITQLTSTYDEQAAAA